mmetsp:Transcript_21492/g.44800  ORF Transcript_21492/g.44800 Transcript_21492/m.44800 type:complete len:204 (+) Transcript_21492:76-687(+)
MPLINTPQSSETRSNASPAAHSPVLSMEEHSTISLIVKSIPPLLSTKFRLSSATNQPSCSMDREIPEAIRRSRATRDFLVVRPLLTTASTIKSITIVLLSPSLWATTAASPMLPTKSLHFASDQSASFLGSVMQMSQRLPMLPPDAATTPSHMLKCRTTENATAMTDPGSHVRSPIFFLPDRAPTSLVPPPSPPSFILFTALS